IAIARAPRIPSVIQRRFSAIAGRTTAKRTRTERSAAELANAKAPPTNAIAAAVESTSRSPRTGSASSRKRWGARETSRMLSVSVPASTTSANQLTSDTPSVTSPNAPTPSRRASRATATKPSARAAPSPAASAPKLATSPRQPASTPGGSSSLGSLKARSSTAAPARFLDGREVSGHVRLLGPETQPGVVAAFPELGPPAGVVLQPAQGGAQLLSGAVDEAAAALLDELRQRAEVVHDRRRPPRDPLEDDAAEGLVPDGRDEHRDRARVQAGELGRVDPAQEPDVRQAGRRGAQHASVRALAGDQEVGVAVVVEGVEQDLDPLDPLEASDEEEVRPLVLRGGGRRCLARRQEAREVPHRPVEAAPPVLLEREPARREEEVDLAGAPVEQASVAPQLRRPPERERAPQAGRLDARLAVELPEDVHRADEPVLVHGVELDAAAVREGVRSADERHVVEVDHVEA